MELRRCTAALLGGLLLLPVAILVTLGVASLLGAMGDQEGGRWLGRLAALEGIVWTLDVVALIALLGATALGCCREPNGPTKPK